MISDGVDIHEAYGTVLNLLVASDKEASYNAFSKRIKECGEDGLRKKMPLFTYDELLSIKSPSLSVDASLFAYDIYGGSARNFNSVSEISARDELV